MIVTLTPNPSVDRTVTLGAALVPGAVHRITSATSQSGGKGVNISRAAIAAGVPTIAVVPALDDDPYVRELHLAGIACHTVAPSGDIRVNLAITDPDGTTTKLNSPGPLSTPALQERLAGVLLDLAAGARWIVLAGSLPPGCPPGWYADLIRALRSTTARIAVDTSDDPLRALVDHLDDAAPDLIKPNDEELASLTGADPTALHADPERAAEAARQLVDRGVGAVLATLGSRGAVLVTADGAWHATPPPTTVISTVGAGDSSLFGYVYADLRGASPEERLTTAVAYGSAAAGLPGTTIPGPHHTHPELVRVHSLASTERNSPR